VNVGEGSIDFKALFAKAKQSGMKHYFIEYDTFPESATSLNSVQTSAVNIKKII
jgi:sugar phosphate isomerase/epimerase